MANDPPGRANDDRKVRDIVSDDGVGADYAILANLGSNNACILANPGSVTNGNSAFESNGLVHYRPGNILVSMKIVGDVDVVRSKNILAEDYFPNGRYVIVLSENATFAKP